MSIFMKSRAITGARSVAFERPISDVVTPTTTHQPSGTFRRNGGDGADVVRMESPARTNAQVSIDGHDAIHGAQLIELIAGPTTARREEVTEKTPPTLSATAPDWTREAISGWQPQRRLLRCIRRHQKWHARRGPFARLMCKYYALKHLFWSAVTGTDIPLSVRIGGGLLLPHPNGVVIHGHARIGPNCLIFHQATLGEGGKKPGVPTLGGHVDVGAGAKLLGGISVGDHAKIGANAVVLCDVPPGRVAVGIPARIV